MLAEDFHGIVLMGLIHVHETHFSKRTLSQEFDQRILVYRLLIQMIGPANIVLTEVNCVLLLVHEIVEDFLLN